MEFIEKGEEKKIVSGCKRFTECVSGLCVLWKDFSQGSKL